MIDPLAERLRGWPRQRVTLDELEKVLLELRPELATSSEKAVRLAAVIEELSVAGVVTPSVKTARRLGVRLPASVIVVRPKPARPANRAPSHPWVEELAWAAGRQWPTSTFDRLVQLNDWLARNPGARPAPVRERSLEVFGEDKELGYLLTGVLGEPGRQPPGLAVFSVSAPMVVRAVGPDPEPVLLVVENATTYHSVLAVAGHQRPGIGWVGYGAGERVDGAIASLADLPLDRLLYFGDLDRRGLAIAATADRVGQARGLPPLEPHRGLYEALLERGRPQSTSPFTWPELGLCWLGAHLSEAVQHHLGTGSWLAQEWVSRTAMEDDPSLLVPRSG